MANAASRTRAGASPRPTATITADPAPSTASCVQIITADTAAAVRPISRSAVAWAATTQKAKPEPVWATLPTMRPSELRRAEWRTIAASATAVPRLALTARDSPRQARVVVPAESDVVAQPPGLTCDQAQGATADCCGGRQQRQPRPAPAVLPDHPAQSGSVHEELVEREVEVVRGEAMFDHDPVRHRGPQPRLS